MQAVAPGRVCTSIPSAAQVASFVVAHSPHTCAPASVYGRDSSAPQAVQVRVSVPASAHVAAFVTFQLPQLWPFAGTATIMVSEHCGQTYASTPGLSQVAGLLFSADCCQSCVWGPAVVPLSPSSANAADASMHTASSIRNNTVIRFCLIFYHSLTSSIPGCNSL